MQSHSPFAGLGDEEAFARRDEAVASLRANPRVAAAALDLDLEQKAAPRPSTFSFTLKNDQDVVVGTFPSTWVWGEDGAPGEIWAGTNWYLEADRAPQAWNLLQAIRAKSPQVQTAMIDGSANWGHADLANVSPHPVCKFNGMCTTLTPDSHGTHVAGTMAATFDNGAGVDGINPVAKVHTTAASFGSSTTWAGALDVWNLLLNDAGPGGSLSNLRAVNFSMGLDLPDRKLMRARHLDNANNVLTDCGPGEADDGTGNESCTPNNEDAGSQSLSSWH